MLIHSITPIQLLIPPIENNLPKTRRCKYGYVEGVAQEDGFTVSRLISTDPNAYLDPDFTPGSKLL